MTDAARNAYLHAIIADTSLEGIYSEHRKQQWAAFSNDDRKKINESRVFVSFATRSGLVSSPFDHVNEDSPFPDIRSEIDRKPYYFELGEITDEGLARSVNFSEKTDEITGGPFSQQRPLLRMFSQKCAKTYQTGGCPLDLLLHYSKQYPAERILLEHIEAQRPEIMRLIKEGPFLRVWIYLDWPPGKVLWQAFR